jgi:hypothetical protein
MSETSEDVLHPVKIVYHNNRYAGTLYDVDGNVLRGESGQRLNVFREEMKDMLVDSKIRVIHYMTREPTYIYFITDHIQMFRFQEERKKGSPDPNKEYHVYLDS